MTSLQFQPDAKFSRRPSADTILVCLNQDASKAADQKNISFEDTDDEEEVAITDIHIAVRRDASLFKIEKVPTKDRALTDTSPSNTIPIVKNKPIIPHDVMMVPEDTKALLNPPCTPQNLCDTAESNADPLLPHIIHVQKVFICRKKKKKKKKN
ncbi:MAG: hypothetical protein JSY10_29600 [Paenibacillus sp.]|nr:hypothetical protein [Paenibacillus sp.]